MRRFFSIGLLSLMLIIALIFILPAAVRAENVGIETPGSGKYSWELIGRSVQVGTDVKHFGYLTRISGLSDELLFSDPVIRTEATAKFTFFIRSFLTARYVRGDTIVTAEPGNMRIYLQKIPSADFKDPGSFRTGDLIARFSVSYRKVFNFEHDNEIWGPGTTVADLKQLVTNQFNLDGKDFTLGQINLTGHLLISDQGHKTGDPFDYSGHFTVEQR